MVLRYGRWYGSPDCVETRMAPGLTSLGTYPRNEGVRGLSRGAAETAAWPRMRKRGGSSLSRCVGCSSAVEQATSWPADPRDRGQPAQRTTHSSASLLPSLLMGFPATSSVAATDDRAAIRA